jgi:virginiamycin B lyase
MRLPHPRRNLWRAFAVPALLAVLALPTATHAQNSLSPFGITRGPDGNVWFTEARGNAIGRITPTGKVTTFRLPSPDRGPQLITAGPDGNLWFVEYNVNRIGRITPSGKLTEFRVPTDLDPTITTPAAYLGGITAGPDGNIWFTEGEGNRICRMTLSGKATCFSLPPAQDVSADAIHNVGAIVAGPAHGPAHGFLWFTDNQAGDLGRISTNGKVQEFEVRSGADSLFGLAAGADGNLWVSDERAGVIKMIKPDGLDGLPSDYNATNPLGLVAGPGGTIWYADPGENEIGRLTPATGDQHEYPLPTAGSAPAFITVGAGGNLWFTESQTDTIGRITPQGVIREFAL